MLSAEQLEMRRSGIGSSDIAAIVGKSPFATPYDVWLSKVEGYHGDQSFATELGDLLEEPVLTLFERRAKPTRMARKPGTIRHPVFSLVLDTPDAQAWFGDELRPVEAKTARFGEDWGEEGTDEIPTHYVLQAMWHILGHRTGAEQLAERCDVPVLIRTDEFRVYRVLWEPELAGVLQEEGERFWKDYVLPRRPPPVDGSRRVDGYLKERFPKDNGVVLEADDEASALAAQLREAEEKEDRWGRVCASAIAQLKLRMGEAQAISGEFGQLVWKQNKPSVVTDFEAIANMLLAQLPEKQRKTILKNHTTPRPGNRPFTKKWSAK